MKKFLFAAVLVLMSAVSCKSQYELLLNSNDTDSKYEAAFDYFNQHKYTKAAQLFESLSVLTGGTSRDDTVQYYWGLSNYMYKDYYTAETNFQKFLESYPRSPFSLEANFLRLDCLYRQTLRYELDQTPTYAALNAMGEYLVEYPSSIHKNEVNNMVRVLNDRLDKKAYEAAKLYYKMEDYLAARVALKNVLKDDAENIYREDILYYIAMASYKYAQLSVPQKQKERYLQFADDYFNFVGELPGSPYKKELDVLYRRSQKALGKDTGAVDEEKTEKDFAKERKQSQEEGK